MTDQDDRQSRHEDVWDVVVYPPGEQDPEHYVGVASCRGSMAMIQFTTDAPAGAKVDTLLAYVTGRTTARVGMFAVMPVDRRSRASGPVWSTLPPGSS